MSDVIPKYQLRLAEDGFRCHILAVLNRAVLRYVRTTGATLAQLAAKVGWAEQDYISVLAGTMVLELDHIALVLLSIECEAHMSCAPIEAFPLPEPPHE